MLGALSLGCATTAPLIPRATPEEAAGFTFPLELPSEGMLHLEGNTAAAILLAMDDFKPRGAVIPTGIRPDESCLYLPQSYDVTSALGTEGVVLVEFQQNDTACPPSPTLSVEAISGKPLQEVTTYAVDIRAMRILAVGVQTRPRP
ncbi:hypothetical protein HUW63_30165 [Myxococcus sp. AM001]|uniref:hypothetical protein n=1 Tax=Myxococcus vastator TaxID=2709664 RepID=UPI0013D7AEEC|nr:hypothetical protein [Myxococcus vastator]NVJ09480.1 hypothetical protein [Myxococcus sp. AM001]